MVSIGRSSSNGGTPPARRRSPYHQNAVPFPLCTSLLSHFLVGVLTFYWGFLAGGSTGSSDAATRTAAQPAAIRGLGDFGNNQQQQQAVFPQSVSGMLVGSTTVPRSDFIREFDIGVPWDDVKSEASDVVLLYSTQSSLPNEPGAHLDSARDATENCDSMKVILTNKGHNNECLAVVQQWSSFHLHHFLRLKPENSTDENLPHFRSDYPFRYVSRRHELSGKTPQLPKADQAVKYWPLLIDYLQKMPTTLERLAPVAKSVASKDNTVVVMVCNWGQSELLVNFVCSTRARGLPLDKILVFATDSETYQLGVALGIAAFDVQDAFGEMPTGAARRYGDKRFMGMMLSKVYCVHLISALGYDLLFQDVDVVWYRNPLSFFQNRDESGDFDFYFQDDGAHSNRYAPYSPNSGFYYVRQNDRTRYFFEVFLRMGELILGA